MTTGTEAPSERSLVRVAYDMTPARLSRAGVGRYTVELRKELERIEGVELIPLEAHPEPGPRLAARIALGARREALFYPLQAGRRARRLGADLFHCPAPFGPGRLDMPLVLTVHDALPWRYPESFTRANVLQQRLLAGPAIRRAARVLTPSEHARGEIVELVGASPSRIVVSPLGVHPRFRPHDRDPEWLSARFGIEGPYVLSVGTLEPRKNLSGLLRAMSEVRRRAPDVLLVVTGGAGWKQDDLAVALQDAAILTGYVSDEELVRLYSGSSCFAYPSQYEGFGLPPLEAMACGAPVVCSDRTSLPEVVGEAGLLVDPESDEAFAEALLSVLEDPDLATDLRKRGLERAAQFTWERCARTTVKTYEQAMTT